MKKIAILGSTGSIGTQTLEVVRENKDIEVLALAAGNNIKLLEQQIREFRPKLAAVWTEEKAKELRENVKDLDVKIVSGMDGLIEAATIPEADCVITAVVGMVGLKPTLAAIRAGKRIGLANKETLVCAGELVMAEAKRCGTEIIPVDSEHSAIYQCLMGSHSREEVKRIILTCSGGPFYGMDKAQLKTVTKADALRHPNWKMGPKITIDCATLMNKGLEVIEAMRLYDLPLEQVDVVIHRQSIVHSMVEFTDGSVKAQLGSADMHTPISYALLYPDRAREPMEQFSILDYPTLTYAAPDRVKYPALDIAYECLERGGTAACVMNGSNEVAVAAFLKGKWGYLDIVGAIRYALDNATFVAKPTLEDYTESNLEARMLAENYLKLR